MRLRALAARRGEEGYAMVTAVAVLFVVGILSATVVSISLHNSTQSGYDRKRVEAIDAAEAGIDYYYSYLQSLTSAPSCSVTKTLTAVPNATFTVTATFYDASNVAYACSGNPPTLSTSVIPSSVLIHSQGKATGVSPIRAMESLAYLTQTKGINFDNGSAIFGDKGVTLIANATIGANLYNDADIYTNGNVQVAANSTLYGSVIAQGWITLQSGSHVMKDVWAGGAVTIGGNATVGGNATSSTSSVRLNGQSHVFRDAKAGTTNTGGIVDGYRTANSPTAMPATRSFPSFTFTDLDWQNAGYAVHTYTNASDCATPLADLANWWGAATGTAHVIRLSGGGSQCLLSLPSETLKGNLAIVSDGNVEFANGAQITVANGTGPWDLYLFAGLAKAPGCSFTSQPGSGALDGVITLIYTPSACSTNIWSNSTLAQGQILSGNVQFYQTASFQFRRVAVPGAGGGSYLEDVQYKREVIGP